VDADEDLRFAGRGGDVEGDVVEVRDHLVDRGGCGAIIESVSITHGKSSLKVVWLTRLRIGL
jgi:hypothetical protein